ncbi:MAG TPA: SRPBCC family protein [Candidatus Eremiobacteraceae bacterium]|nr:SRPBCC family protein [Candidatus Eremiobacteraceae bacterium]
MKTVLRWIGSVFGLIAFLVVVVIAIGIGLPMRHVAQCSAYLTVPPAVVWSAVYDDTLSAAWRPDVARVERISNGPDPEFREFGKSGGSITYQNVDATQPFAFERDIVDRSLPFGGGWRYWLAPKSGGTQLTITENGEIYNPIFRIVSRYFTGYTATMTAYISELGTHFHEQPQVSCRVEARG